MDDTIESGAASAEDQRYADMERYGTVPGSEEERAALEALRVQAEKISDDYDKRLQAEYPDRDYRQRSDNRDIYVRSVMRELAGIQELRESGAIIPTDPATLSGRTEEHSLEDKRHVSYNNGVCIFGTTSGEVLTAVLGEASGEAVGKFLAENNYVDGSVGGSGYIPPRPAPEVTPSP